MIPIFSPDGRALSAAYSSGNAYRGRRLTRPDWEHVLPGRAYDPAC